MHHRRALIQIYLSLILKDNGQSACGAQAEATPSTLMAKAAASQTTVAAASAVTARPAAAPATAYRGHGGCPSHLVDGFNTPVSMAPACGGRGCGAASGVDLIVCCPSVLSQDRERKVVR